MEEILVGGMSETQLNLSRTEIQQIWDCCSADTGTDGVISEVADAFLSLSRPLHCPDGMLFRAGEHVLLDDSHPKSVAKLQKILCASIDSKYQKFAK